VRVADSIGCGIVQKSADDIKAIMKQHGSKVGSEAINEHQGDWMNVKGNFVFEFVEYEKESKDKDKDKKAKKETEVKLTVTSWQAAA
jgi:hypothetical protein